MAFETFSELVISQAMIASQKLEGKTKGKIYVVKTIFFWGGTAIGRNITLICNDQWVMTMSTSELMYTGLH